MAGSSIVFAACVGILFHPGLAMAMGADTTAICTGLSFDQALVDAAMTALKWVRSMDACLSASTWLPQASGIYDCTCTNMTAR